MLLLMQVQPCHRSNLMQSLSHIYTYQVENRNILFLPTVQTELTF